MTYKPFQQLLTALLGLSLSLNSLPSAALAQPPESPGSEIIALDNSAWDNLDLPKPSQTLSKWSLQSDEPPPASETTPGSSAWFDLSSKPFDGSPELAAGISMLFPGAGYWYINEPQTALLNAPLIIPLLAPHFIQADTYQSSVIKSQTLYWANDLMRYSVFDTYQSALDKLGRPARLLEIPHYSFAEMFFAPLNPKTYWSEHWISNILRLGLLGCLVLINGYQIATQGIHPDARFERAIWIVPSILAFASITGVSEEVFARGTIQPIVTELSQNPWIGNLTQATYFGLGHTTLFAGTGLNIMPLGLGAAAHFSSPLDYSKEFYLPNVGASDIPDNLQEEGLSFLRTFAMGWMFGWMLDIDAQDDGLLKNITFHTLFDTLGMLSTFLLYGHTGRVGFTMVLPF